MSSLLALYPIVCVFFNLLPAACLRPTFFFMNIWYATHNEFSVQVLEQFKQHLLHPKQHMLKILCGVFSLLFIVLITTKLIAVDNLGGPNNLFSTENSLCVAYQMFIKKCWAPIATYAWPSGVHLRYFFVLAAHGNLRLTVRWSFKVFLSFWSPMATCAWPSGGHWKYIGILGAHGNLCLAFILLGSVSNFDNRFC